MAQACLEEDEGNTLVLSTTIEERVWLDSPQTTTLSKDDLNLLKQITAYSRRDKDDESLQFININAWKIYTMARKTEEIPEQEAAEIENTLNSSNNIMTGLLFAFLGTPGANLINMSNVTDPERFTKGPLARLTALAVIYTVMGQDMERHIPEDLVEQVTQPLATLANNLQLKTDKNIIGLCVTNHIHKVLTECSTCQAIQAIPCHAHSEH